MSQIRKIHLDSLPRDKLFIVLGDNFRKELFKRLYKKIGGSTILSRIIKNVKNEEVRRWKTGKRSIPLYALIKLVKLLNNGFSVNEIEKYIIAYRGKSSKNAIFRPNLPLIEDERLIRFVTHIMCDGYDGGKTHGPSYANTEKSLVDAIEKDLECFGKVNTKMRHRVQKNRKKIYLLEMPRIITYIIRKIYKINFRSKKVRLPKEFFNHPPYLAYQVIKAFADDESSVGEHCICFLSVNKKFLNDIRKLLILRVPGIKRKGITKTKYKPHSKCYEFRINRDNLPQFYKYVNYTHPNKKQKLLFILNRSQTTGNKFPKGVAKEIILDLLSKKQMTSNELAFELGIKPKNVRYHLFNLERDKKVGRMNKVSNYSVIWSVKK